MKSGSPFKVRAEEPFDKLRPALSPPKWRTDMRFPFVVSLSNHSSAGIALQRQSADGNVNRLIKTHRRHEAASDQTTRSSRSAARDRSKASTVRSISSSPWADDSMKPMPPIMSTPSFSMASLSGWDLSGAVASASLS